MPVAVLPLQPAQPVHLEPRKPVTVLRRPERYIFLCRKIGGSAIIAAVIDDQEMTDTQLSVVLQKVRQTRHFIAQGHKTQDHIRLDQNSSVLHRRDLAPLTPDTKQKAAPFPAHPIGHPQVASRHSGKPAAYCAALRVNGISAKKAASSSRRSSRASANATVACKKPALDPQSKRCPSNR